MPQTRPWFGDMHDNTHQYEEQDPPFDEIVDMAAAHLDFYAAAYYTPLLERRSGECADGPWTFLVEKWKDRERLAREWAEVVETTAAKNADGRFVTFPGYEWQGDGTWGDFNCFFPNEDAAFFSHATTAAELFDDLRGRDALAVPHHVGYQTGRRAPRWTDIEYEESLVPFAEIYSCHGCSEMDDEHVPMRSNRHMGPNVGGSTWADALDAGLRLGAICSTDNWHVLPGFFNRGLAAVRAPECTRAALWDAMRRRCVYGVTGDRIDLEFTLDGAPMGSVVAADGPRRIAVRVSCMDALDRIEILRDNRVVATSCHRGTWSVPTGSRPERWRLRVECGWGPDPDELPGGPRRMEGELSVDGGTVYACTPCWISPGQGRPVLAGDTASFSHLVAADLVTERRQNANVYEFDAAPDAELRLRVDGMEIRDTVAAVANRSRLLVDETRAAEEIRACSGIDAFALDRRDTAFHMALKTKIHRAVPRAAYEAEFAFEDDTPLEGESHYRVRVEQQNGQRAWSSPVWVRPEQV